MRVHASLNHRERKTMLRRERKLETVDDTVEEE
jgi:hypothetical protein